MASTPSDTTSNPAGVSDTDNMGRKWDAYKQDQLHKAQTTASHAQELKAQAKHRIAVRKQTVEAAGVPDNDNSQGASNARYHALNRMLDEVAFYPAHDQRKESPSYARVHHQMTVVDDKRCLVCGVKHSTLNDPAQNPFGAIAMETHHHIIEWALANAIDANKFNQHILPGLKRQASQRSAGLPAPYTEFDADYASSMTLDRIKQWVDHAADNLWVLCDVHHRHKFVGIHAITYPIWGPQDVVEQGLIDQEIAQAKSAGKNSDV